MKFEGLLAINAAIEMAMNVLFGVGGQLAVDIGSSSFSVSLQSAISGIPTVVDKPRAFAYSYNSFCIAFLPRCRRDITFRLEYLAFLRFLCTLIPQHRQE